MPDLMYKLKYRTETGVTVLYGIYGCRLNACRDLRNLKLQYPNAILLTSSW